MTEELKQDPKIEEIKAETEETKAQTEQIKAAASSVIGLIAFCVSHPIQTVAVLIAAGLVIAFSVSGWQAGPVKKNAVEIRR